MPLLVQVDVYKRQGQSLGSTEAWDGKIKIDESWKRIELSHSFVLRKLKAEYKVERQVPRPVSYTHLDVYKRQRKDFSRAI